ncbi:hypothetical protein IW261DRAFT_1553593 [Armillaria novae-zelandiae]|uniref:FAD-binding PCMH-type domain-containing protein n=1 Tax=Armillaria novae-zelandiae TaxID=153914 RepID=A0AA39NSM9_9AGAR|nr:hypothetical protein IW261DRAFT_1553593 [Armillaria novae-zelandiae]
MVSTDNLRFNFSPAAVTYPSTTEQVVAVVALGSSENLQIVARSGGHNYIANGLGGKNGAIVIDLSNMTRVDIDASSGTATIETGNRLRDVAFALNNQAMEAALTGRISFGTAGGGFGFASRMWGLTLDTVQSMTVVLANSTIVTASSTSIHWSMASVTSKP